MYVNPNNNGYRVIAFLVDATILMIELGLVELARQLQSNSVASFIFFGCTDVALLRLGILMP